VQGWNPWLEFDSAISTAHRAVEIAQKQTPRVARGLFLRRD
jgi:hypothetical protein